MSLEQTYQLIQGALGGDAGAHGDLLERIRPRIVLWCAGRMSQGLRAKVEPEDVAQEVLLAVHKALPSYRGPNQRTFFGWLFRIAENRIRDLVDYHGALKRRPGEALSFTQTTPSRAVGRVEAAERLQRGLAELSEDYRLVIRLRRIEERSRRETAEAMGRSEAAVRVLYWRAMQALAKVLTRMEKENEGVIPREEPRSD